MIGLCCGLRAVGVFFFKHKTAYEMRISDRSSDVCSSDLGGYIDIVLDFIAYALLALSFAIRDPAAAALPAAFLLASFMGTASSFLAYAILAGRHGRETSLLGRKSFYHLGGLTEGTETLEFFALCLVLPSPDVRLVGKEGGRK